MARRIKQADIKFISLCPRGANRLQTIYKDDGTFDMEMLVKASDQFQENGEIVACVYAPEVRDSQGDIADAAVIKDMAYRASKNRLQVDIRHDEKPVGNDRAYVAEHFLIQKGDPRFAGMKTYEGKEVDVTGGWGVVIKVDDPVLRQEYRDGKWKGVSMGGRAKMESETETVTIKSVLAGLGKLLGLGDVETTTEKEDDMKPEEIQKAVTDAMKPLAEGIDKLCKVLAPEKKVEGETKKEGEVKKDDDAPKMPKVVNAKTLKLCGCEKRKYDITKNLDVSDAEAVNKAAEDIEKIDAEIAELNKTEDKKDGETKKSAEDLLKEKHEKELADLRKRSNQSSTSSTTTAASETEADQLEKIGKEMGAMANKGSSPFTLVPANK